MALQDPGPALELAELLRGADRAGVQLRIGVVTAVEGVSPFRVKVAEIGGTAWLSRTRDVTIAVSDKVWLLQSGAVILVGGRLY